MHSSKAYLCARLVNEALELDDLTELKHPAHAIGLLLDEVLEGLKARGWPDAQVLRGPRIVSAQENMHGDFRRYLYWFTNLYGVNRGYSMTRYQHLANLLAQRIEQGLYRSGERLPSVRALSQEHGVSISTIQQAYQILENRQLITPQPRSGYFVSQKKALPPVPAMTRPVQRPVDVTQWDDVMMLLDARGDREMISFGGGSPCLTQTRLVQNQRQHWRRHGQPVPGQKSH